MRKSIIALIPVLVILALLSLSACSTKSAPVFVDFHYTKVKDYLTYAGQNLRKKSFQVDSHFLNDTIFFAAKSPIQHLELFYLFDNEICRYQEIKLYCGPCTDKMMADILKDKDYRFKAVDKVNYISEINPRIILRLTSGVDRDSVTCNSISVRKI